MPSHHKENSDGEVLIKDEQDEKPEVPEVDSEPRWRMEHANKAESVFIQEQAAIDGAKFLESMQSLLKTYGEKIPNCSSWCDKIDTVLQAKSEPTVSIGFIGTTGSGKSALVSALCGIEGLLPSSSDRATTAVVTRILYNKSNNLAERLRAEIELVTENELKLELDTLLDDINARKDSEEQRDGLETIPMNVETAQIVEQARGRVLTLFPHHDAKTLENVTSEDLLADPAISEILGTTKIICRKDLAEFFSAIKPFIDSTPTRQGSHRKFAYWPLVKLVTLYVKAEQLRGLALYDLPGTLDTNAARSTVADKFKKNLDMTCVVARITRGADDSSAHELLADADSLRLKLDGNYNGEHLIYVMSMCDQLKIPEYFQNYPRFKDYMADELEKETRLTEDVKKLTIQKRDEERQISILEKELRRVRKQIQKVKCDAGFVNTRKRKQAGDDSSTGSSSKITSQSAETQIIALAEKEKQLETQVSEKKSTSFNINKNITRSSTQLHYATSRIMAACIKDRNRRATEAVKVNFRAERAGLASEMAKDSEGRSKELQVFCVSSEAYFQLAKKDKPPLPPLGFHQTSLTNIPNLRKFCQNSSFDLRRKITSEFLTELNGVRRSLKSWADDKTADAKIASTDRPIVEKVFKVHKEVLEEQLNIIRDGSIKLIRHNVAVKVRDAVSQAVGPAMKAAEQTGVGWEGIHWSTYRATCRRLGMFRSSRGITHDWNDEMLVSRLSHAECHNNLVHRGNNLLRSLLDTWDRCFNAELPKLYARHSDEACNKVLAFDKELMGSIQIMFPILIGPLRRLEEASRDVQHELKDDVEGILSNLKGKVREIHALVKPVIQSLMNDVYMECNARKGSGTHMLNKQSMKVHIRKVGQKMFQEAATNMNTAIDKAVNDLVEQFDKATENAIDQIYLDFQEMLDKHTSESSRTSLPRAASKETMEIQEKIQSAIAELDRVWASDLTTNEPGEAKFETFNGNYVDFDENSNSNYEVSSDSDDSDYEE